MTKEKKHQKIERERLLVVCVAMGITLLIAAGAGLSLALIDTQKGIGDLVSIVSHKNHEQTAQQDEAVQAVAILDQKLMDKINEVSDETQPDVAAKETENPVPLSDETVSGNTVSGNTVSENTISDNTVSENAVPEGTVSDNAGPENSATDNTVSGNQLPEGMVSDNSVSDQTTDPNAVAQTATTPIPFPIGGQLVDESYFNDALFIGDSRMEGFGMHSGLNATFYAATGLQLHKIDTYKVVRTPNGKVPIFSVLQPNLYKKVYIKVGLNELGWGSDELFLQEYADLIARIRALEPGAIIYVHGLIHVTAAKSQTDPVHTNEKINARNALLQQFALQQQAYYIDINEVVSDANGALLPDLTSDGIHLKAQYMEVWKNYLMAHAVVVQ